MADTVDIENADSLVAYLHRAGYLEQGARPEVKVLAGGVSNRTVWVCLPSGETWVLKQALGKLRVAVDWFSSPERIHREADGMRTLAALTCDGSIPKLVFEDHRHHVLAMEAVPEPHDNWKDLLLAGHLKLNHVRQFADLLGTIHSKAYEQRAELAGRFSDQSFFESLRLEPYYAYTASRVQESATFLERLITDTRRSRLSLVHGDYSPKNVLVHRDRLVLLDHEVIHFGDPAFDVGFSMTHLLSKAHYLQTHRQAFEEAAMLYWESYQSKVKKIPWSDDFEPRCVRHTLACLLARVAGRSPLEYLDDHQRSRQHAIVVSLLSHPPLQMTALIRQFVGCLNVRNDL